MSALNFITTFRLQTSPNVAKLLRISSSSRKVTKLHYSEDNSNSKNGDQEKKIANNSFRWKFERFKRLEYVVEQQKKEIKINESSKPMLDSPSTSAENSPLIDSTASSAKKFKRKLDPSKRLESMLGVQNIKIDNINAKVVGNENVESSKDSPEPETGIFTRRTSSMSKENGKNTSNESKSVQENSETSSSQFSSSKHKENPIQGSSQPSTEDKAKFFASRTTRRSKLTPLERYNWMVENADNSLKERLELDVDESLKDLKKLADDKKDKQ